eukprot:6198871-Pleurochrysis_carterae.AAC.2
MTRDLVRLRFPVRDRAGQQRDCDAGPAAHDGRSAAVWLRAEAGARTHARVRRDAQGRSERLQTHRADACGRAEQRVRTICTFRSIYNQCSAHGISALHTISVLSF